MKKFVILSTLFVMMAIFHQASFATCLNTSEIKSLIGQTSDSPYPDTYLEICVDYTIEPEEINQALIAHYPKLEVLQFTWHHHYLGEIAPMAPLFKNLINLREVRGDFFPKPVYLPGQKWPEFPYEDLIERNRIFTRADYKKYLAEKRLNEMCQF